MPTRHTPFIKLLPLLMVIIIDTMGFGLILPILSPLFMDSANGILSPHTSFFWRSFLYGVSLTVFTVAVFFGASFLGHLSDYWGRKKVLMLSLFGIAVSLFVSAVGILIGSVSLLILGRCLTGFSSGSQPIAQAAIVDMSDEQSKAVNIGIMSFSGALGIIIGPIIGGYFANSHLVSWFNYSTPFLVSSLLAIGNIIAVYFALKKTPQVKTHVTPELVSGLTIFLSGFRDAKIRPLVIILLLFQTAFAIFLTAISIFVVSEYKFSSVNLGHFMAYFGLILALSYLLGVRVMMKILSLNNILKLGLFIPVVAMLVLLWPSHLLVWLVLIPIGISNALSYTVTLTLLSNCVGKNEQGRTMGISASITAVAWGIGALIAGSLIAYYPTSPFLVAACVNLAALIILMFYQKLYQE